jgi:hypothetical protein
MSEIVKTPSPLAADRDAFVHRLALVKGHDRWNFSWEQGGEASVMQAVAELARNPQANFDWFDAAVVSHHVTRSTGRSFDAPCPNQNLPGSPA